jgi:hypothetical protein
MTPNGSEELPIAGNTPHNGVATDEDSPPRIVVDQHEVQKQKKITSTKKLVQI